MDKFMKEFTVKTTRAKELAFLAIGFIVFLTGLFAVRYTWALAWLMLGGVALMAIAGDNLQQIDDQKRSADGH